MGSSRNKGDLFRNNTLPEVFDKHSVAFYSSTTPAPLATDVLHSACTDRTRVEQGSGNTQGDMAFLPNVTSFCNTSAVGTTSY